MNEGAQFLIGTFDFRNLCKMDVGNGVTNFMRTISKAFISRLPENGFPGRLFNTQNILLVYLLSLQKTIV